MFKQGASLAVSVIVSIVIVALGVGLYHWWTHRSAA